MSKLNRTSEYLCYFVSLIPGTMVGQGIKVGRKGGEYQTECSTALSDEKTWMLHTSLLGALSPPSRSDCESGGGRTGEKRARGRSGHAQLKGVNRPVAAVGAARRGAHQDIDESLRRGVFSTKRDVITLPPSLSVSVPAPLKTGCNNRLSAMSPLVAPNSDPVKDASDSIEVSISRV